MPRQKADPSVKDTWKRLKAWCKDNYPKMLASLAPPASAAVIRKLEKAIGQSLPADVRDSYRIHNGQGGAGADMATGLLFGLPILPLSQVLRQWRDWREHDDMNEELLMKGWRSFPDDAIKVSYTNPGWIPLSEDYGGNHLGVDLDPGPAGMIGQVITFGRDEDDKYVAAWSWADFLDDIADKLEAGNFVITGPDSDGPYATSMLQLRDPPMGHYHEAIREMYKKQHPSKSKKRRR